MGVYTIAYALWDPKMREIKPIKLFESHWRGIKYKKVIMQKQQHPGSLSCVKLPD
jgi:hypothetical protein